MAEPLDRLSNALSDRYTLERELGQGGMATVLAAESRGSAGVAEATGLSQPRGVCRFA